MTIQDAISKAIEGGYEVLDQSWLHGYSVSEKGIEIEKFDYLRDEKFRENLTWYSYTRPITEILLDPAFWQALGKSMGWEEDCKYMGTIRPEWYCIWHVLIEHLYQGKSIESYFDSL